MSDHDWIIAEANKLKTTDQQALDAKAAQDAEEAALAAYGPSFWESFTAQVRAQVNVFNQQFPSQPERHIVIDESVYKSLTLTRESFRATVRQELRHLMTDYTSPKVGQSHHAVCTFSVGPDGNVQVSPGSTSEVARAFLSRLF